MIIINGVEYINVDNVFRRVKELLKPTPDKSTYIDGYTLGKQQDYQYISQWLHQNGYYMEQLPNAFSDGASLVQVGNGLIRSAIQTMNNDFENNVLWAERMAYIEKLTLKNNNITDVIVPIKTDLMDIIKNISNRNASFMELSLNEKLSNLNNAIEYLLKPGKHFESVEESIFYGFLNNDDVIKFRKETQMFRHASPTSMQERENFSKEKKEFYVGVGILIVTAINMHKNL